MADHCSWQEGQGKTFKILEEKMTTHPVIVLPDFPKGFRLSTDASDAAIGSTLEQAFEAHIPITSKKHRIINSKWFRKFNERSERH